MNFFTSSPALGWFLGTHCCRDSCRCYQTLFRRHMRDCSPWILETVVEQTKFLGVILDNKLTFLQHICYLKEKCVKALNFLRVVVCTAWGTDQHTLLHVY